MFPPSRPWLAGVLLGLPLLLSCNHGKRAVEACEELAETLECGDTDFYSVLDCNGYADTECNIVRYFDCLEDNFECTDGVASLGGDCNVLAECD
jgi:hypothetical protein